MASEWELGMGMGFGFGMAAPGPASVAPSLAAAAAPNYAVAGNSQAYLYGLPSTDTLRIDDLLDFSNHDVFSAAADGHAINSQMGNSLVAGSRPFAAESGSSSTYHSHSRSFADEIYIPSEEAAELEWLSKFVEDSFSDVPYPSSYLHANPQAGSGGGAVDPAASAAAPGRGARSKRSCLMSSANQSSSSSSTSSSSSSDFPPAAHISGGSSGGRKMEGGYRRCTHCASEKTPQWRTGPLGPKTLCNACGVRHKSGRLVPEYRPAASPTFVLTQHSNSHRKVVELRRQKEQIQLLRHEGQHNAASRPDIIFQN